MIGDDEGRMGVESEPNCVIKMADGIPPSPPLLAAAVEPLELLRTRFIVAIIILLCHALRSVKFSEITFYDHRSLREIV